MWIKICANTNADDALRAVELGADAVGFVFAPSKRQVTAAQVAPISALLPLDVERVGVFAAMPAKEIAATVHQAGLTAVQLHGSVDPELAGKLCAALGPEISIIHTIHWNVEDVERSEAELPPLLDALSQLGPQRVLVDAKVGSASGGLGVSFDWARAQKVLARYSTLRFIIAGGLKPGNVAEAVSVFAPYGVDVASGVEQQPGQKDAGKLKEFIENARQA